LRRTLDDRIKEFRQYGFLDFIYGGRVKSAFSHDTIAPILIEQQRAAAGPGLIPLKDIPALHFDVLERDGGADGKDDASWVNRGKRSQVKGHVYILRYI
jgi:hypothetical protein